MKIHDNNFKYNFKKPEVARAFLLHNLFKNSLLIDLSTLQLEDNEFVRFYYTGNRRADVLYSARTIYGEKIYFHFEAQRTPEEYMAVRIRDYDAGAGRSHLQAGGKYMPLVISFVFYNGKQPWQGARSVAELFEDFDLYVRQVLKRPFLINLNEKKVSELQTQGAAAGPQLIMKGACKGDYFSMLDVLHPLLKKHNQIDAENVSYMASNDEHGEEAFLKKFSNFEANETTKVKTMFERAKKKSRQEGLLIGRQEGMEEGLILGRQEGKEEGLMLGRQKTISEMYKKLLTLGVNRDIIEKAMPR